MAQLFCWAIFFGSIMKKLLLLLLFVATVEASQQQQQQPEKSKEERRQKRKEKKAAAERHKWEIRQFFFAANQRAPHEGSDVFSTLSLLLEACDEVSKELAKDPSLEALVNSNQAGRNDKKSVSTKSKKGRLKEIIILIILLINEKLKEKKNI